MLSTNCSPAVENGCQNGIHSCQRAPLLYKLAKDILIYNMVTRFYIIWTITWSLAIIMGDSEINDNKKNTSNAGNFDGHGDAPVQCRAHLPIEHILGFTWSHWMMPSGECSHRIAEAAAMVDDFGQKHKNGRPKPDSMRILRPETNTLISSSKRQALFECETARLELKSLATFLAFKCCVSGQKLESY